VLALLGALVVAALFALLANWQLDRSVDASAAERPDTETPIALESIAEPQTAMLPDAFGRTVETTLRIVPGDTVVLSGRVNTVDPGWVVVVHAKDASGASLAVAVGWAGTEADALVAAAELDAGGELGTVLGRYLPTESPQLSDFEAGERSALAVAELVNLWAEAPTADGAPGVYGGYLVLTEALAGLDAVDAPAPSREVEFNLLNLFYALEWVIFAGFAVFLWWRLVRDEIERLAEESSSSDPSSPADVGVS
jgi:cytochrome oxidase assembly protein ShyY1